MSSSSLALKESGDTWSHTLSSWQALFTAFPSSTIVHFFFKVIQQRPTPISHKRYLVRSLNMSESISTTKKTFMNLPSEVRLMIYEYVLPMEVTLVRRYTGTFNLGGGGESWTRTFYDVHADQHMPPMLFSVSKQVQQESRPILVERTILIPNPGDRFFGCKMPLYKSLMTRFPTSVQNVDIPWSAKSLNFGAYGQDFDLRQLPRLKTVRLTMTGQTDEDVEEDTFDDYACDVLLEWYATGRSFSLQEYLRRLCRKLYVSYGEGAFIDGIYAGLASRCQVSIEVPDHDMKVWWGTWCVEANLEVRQ